MKIATAAVAALIAIAILIGGIGQAIVKVFVGGGSTQPSPDAFTDIPPDYLVLYQAAAPVCPGLDWSILAAIGKIESNHGRSTLPGVAEETQNSAGARGPMQLLQPTFDEVVARHPIPPGGRNPPSPWDKHDAIFAAAFYLCQNQVSRDLRSAIFAYNHADWYVNQVLAQAAQYRQAGPGGSVACSSLQPPVLSAAGQLGGDRALIVVAFTCAQLGKPYVWGGNGDPGFDCSGLTHAAYAAAGITIPRTAQTQYNAGPLLPPGAPLLPGDLVFFGTPTRIHHVGISLGGTLMINAPTFGQPVQVDDIRSFRDLAGASRPTAGTVGT
jgi:cell wall-associated NlpC family hydrolase